MQSQLPACTHRDTPRVEAALAGRSPLAVAAHGARVDAGRRSSTLATNRGVFVPFALEVVSETDPSRTEYFVEWTVYTVLGLLPLAVAIVLLVVARDGTEGVLDRARGWLVLHARTIGAVLVITLAASLLRGGIAGLTS